MNIVVLAGGLSTERDVSLSSGSMVADALQKQGHKVALVDVFFGLETLPDPITDLFSSEKKVGVARVAQDEPDLEKIRAMRGDSGFGEIGKNVIEVCRAADIVYMGLHGENGENGRLQAMFDVLGIRYTGSGYLGSAMAMNKWVTKEILLRRGIETPVGKSFYRGESLEGIGEIPLPAVVKPCSGGSSIGVSLVKDRAELTAAVEEAFRYEDEVLAEQFVAGREFSVGVLGGRVLPPIEIIPKEGFYDYAHKYQPGWTEEICPANITKEQEKTMQDAALAVFRALKLCVYGRVDFILDQNDRAYCLEANTLPGMTPTSLLPQEAAVLGISYGELCEEVIRLSMEKWGK